MNDIRIQRCFHHPQREAVARCPECARYYCRECIAEHEARVLCSDCLARRAAARASGRRERRFGLVLRATVALLLLWFLFYGFGRILLALPTAFHEGHIWTYPAEWRDR